MRRDGSGARARPTVCGRRATLGRSRAGVNGRLRVARRGTGVRCSHAGAVSAATRSATTISRNEVSRTSTPAMTRATTSGSGWPSSQPEAAAKAATARKTRRTPADHRRRCRAARQADAGARPVVGRRRPASRVSADEEQDDAERHRAADERGPDQRRRRRRPSRGRSRPSPAPSRPAIAAAPREQPQQPARRRPHRRRRVDATRPARPGGPARRLGLRQVGALRPAVARLEVDAHVAPGRGRRPTGTARRGGPRAPA